LERETLAQGYSRGSPHTSRHTKNLAPSFYSVFGISPERRKETRYLKPRLSSEVDVVRGAFLGSRERVPFCLGDAVLIVYALLFGVFALCVMSFTGAIFESHRRRL